MQAHLNFFTATRHSTAVLSPVELQSWSSTPPLPIRLRRRVVQPASSFQGVVDVLPESVTLHRDLVRHLPERTSAPILLIE